LPSHALSNLINIMQNPGVLNCYIIMSIKLDWNSIMWKIRGSM